MAYGRCIANILGNCQKVLQSSYPTFMFWKVVYEISSCLHVFQHWYVNLTYSSFSSGCIIVTHNLYFPLITLCCLLLWTYWSFKYFLLSVQILCSFCFPYLIINYLYYSSYLIFILIANIRTIMSQFQIICCHI